MTAQHMSDVGYWPGVARRYLRIFRTIVVSACVLGAIIGFFERVDWLLAVSVCVGIGELLESSYYLAVMGWGKRSGRLALPD